MTAFSGDFLIPKPPSSEMVPGPRPMTRWWWFEGHLLPEDITAQLEWLVANGFGGAEVAWWKEGSTKAPSAPEFLSEEWSEACRHAASEAARLGLRLDFTFGTQWPFGGTWVREEHAAQTWSGPSKYRLRVWWKMPPGDLPPRVINHLDHNALEAYADPLAGALAPALAVPAAHSLFCDSWELPTNPPLWTDGFAEKFEEEFGYDLRHLMNYLEYHRHARYDYRKLLSQLVVEEFYQAFTNVCHGLGTTSRSQCQGAPCDLLAAYLVTDIPETETLLFDPHFASFAVSAAAIGHKPVVTCESFTALYGLSRSGPPGFQREHAADIKLVADAMFAHGVNRIVWHGMPYNPPHANPEARNVFGATCHVGPDAAFAGDLPALNAYFARTSEFFTGGIPDHRVAVYLPLEDQWMRHLLDEETMRPSAHYHWELQHIRFPAALEPWQPCWISPGLLTACTVENAHIVCGGLRVPFLFVDVEWLDPASVDHLLHLARLGATIHLARTPAEPGYLRHNDYKNRLQELASLATPSPVPKIPPVLTSRDGRVIPEFRARLHPDELRIFLAHPATRDVTYPLRYGQSGEAKTESRALTIHAFERNFDIDLNFQPLEAFAVSVHRDGTIHCESHSIPLSIPKPGQAFPRDHRYPGYVIDTPG